MTSAPARSGYIDPSGFLEDVTGEMIDMPAELPRLLER
jgi:hypothetical protein